jgi:hypothetical protein
MNIPKFENPPEPPVRKYYYLGKDIQQCSKEELLDALKYSIDKITELTNNYRDAELSKIEWMGIAAKIKFNKP